MRELLRTADARLAPSRFLRDRMAALGVGGIEVVANGHSALPTAPPVPATNGRVRFGYVGAVIPSKGVHVLAQAFRLLADPRAELQIHGPVLPYHGDEGYGERLRDSLGPNAGALRGAFPHEGRGVVLAGLDVLVVPSIWEENAPLTVHEAFQARLPVVASGHGGLAELVRDGLDGLLFRPGDAHDLARAMRRLMDDGERKRLGNDPPSVPSLPDHVIALEAIYTRVRASIVRRPGRIGAVIVDYRRPEQAAAAARSILDDAGSMPVTVVVVENGPSPTINLAGVEVVRLAVNGGYAAGVNAGVARLRAAGCDRVLLLNNDARLQPGSLRRLAEAVGEDGAAAVAPVVIRAGDGRVESRGARFDLRTGRHRLLGHGETAYAGEGLVEAEALAGPALMLRLDAFDRIGPFDEAYFHYFEESEWCARARCAGLRLAVVLGARVVHEGAETLGPASADRLYYASRNHLRAVERLLELEGARRWLRRAAVVGLNLAHALRQDDVPRAAGLAAVLRGARDFLQGRSGPLRRAS
jgi:GT2 family glycosyltransferase